MSEKMSNERRQDLWLILVAVVLACACYVISQVAPPVVGKGMESAATNLDHQFKSFMTPPQLRSVD